MEICEKCKKPLNVIVVVRKAEGIIRYLYGKYSLSEWSSSNTRFLCSKCGHMLLIEQIEKLSLMDLV